MSMKEVLGRLAAIYLALLLPALCVAWWVLSHLVWIP